MFPSKALVAYGLDFYFDRKYLIVSMMLNFGMLSKVACQGIQLVCVPARFEGLFRGKMRNGGCQFLVFTLVACLTSQGST